MQLEIWCRHRSSCPVIWRQSDTYHSRTGERQTSPFMPGYYTGSNETCSEYRVGAVVGGLPPLMGWDSMWRTAYFLRQPGFFPASVLIIRTYRPLDPLINRHYTCHCTISMFMLSLSWAIPAFNSLPTWYEDRYAQARYRMLSVLSPSHNSLVASAMAVPPCSHLFDLNPALGLTTGKLR